MLSRAYRILLRLSLLAVLCVLCLVVPSNIYTRRLPVSASTYGSNEHLTSTLNSTVKTAVSDRQALRGCGLLLDATTGEVIAATTVTRDIHARTVTDMVTQAAWEPGSVMKPLLVAAAIDKGVVNPDKTSFANDSTFVDDFYVTNAVSFTKDRFSLQDIISYSINSGAIKVLKSFSTHNTIDQQSRSAWHDYLVSNYRFGEETGINVPYEASGYVAPPDTGPDIDFHYGNMAIGQGLTTTPLQLASAYAAIVNGGTYYRPYIRDAQHAYSTPLQRHVVSPATSDTMREILQKAYTVNWPTEQHAGLLLGGKSGTAHVADQSGEYQMGHDNGAYIGYITHDSHTLVLLIRLDQPHTDTFASHEAGKAWINFVQAAVDSLKAYPQQ